MRVERKTLNNSYRNAKLRHEEIQHESFDFAKELDKLNSRLNEWDPNLVRKVWRSYKNAHKKFNRYAKPNRINSRNFN